MYKRQALPGGVPRAVLADGALVHLVRGLVPAVKVAALRARALAAARLVLAAAQYNGLCDTCVAASVLLDVGAQLAAEDGTATPAATAAAAPSGATTAEAAAAEPADSGAPGKDAGRSESKSSDSPSSSSSSSSRSEESHSGDEDDE